MLPKPFFQLKRLKRCWVLWFYRYSIAVFPNKLNDFPFLLTIVVHRWLRVSDRGLRQGPQRIIRLGNTTESKNLDDC